MWLIMVGVSVWIRVYECVSVSCACIIASSAQCWCFHMLVTFRDFCQGFSFCDVVWKTLLRWYFAMQCALPTQTYHPNLSTSACGAYGILHDDFFSVICKYTLSRPKVLVRAKPQPCSKALRIMGVLVVGGALASPNGLGNLIPHISMLMSTVSMAQWNKGSLGVVLTVLPWRDCRENTHI